MEMFYVISILINVIFQIDLRRKQSAQLSGYEEDRESGDEIGELESPMVKFTDGQVPILTQTPVVTDNHQFAFIPSSNTGSLFVFCKNSQVTVKICGRFRISCKERLGGDP